jgi:hypothetical protein
VFYLVIGIGGWNRKGGAGMQDIFSNMKRLRAGHQRSVAAYVFTGAEQFPRSLEVVANLPAVWATH